MTRALDALAAVLAALVLSALAVEWSRPEDVFLALIAVVALRLLVRPRAAPAWAPGRIVAAGVALYALVFSFIAVTRHRAFQTHALDLGYYVQLLWSLHRGLGPYVSLPEMHAWGDHFSPTLYLLVPLFALFPGPEVLLVVQSVAFALGALPLYGLARRRLGADGPAAGFALLYLLSPTLHGINLRDFHIAAFAIPLLLWAVYAVERNRMEDFVAAVILTLGCREDAALAVIGLGAWLALARRRWLWGAGVAGASLLLLFLDTQVLMPFFRGGPYPHLQRYAHLGGSLGGILFNMTLHPLRTLGYMVSGPKLLYLVTLLAPLGFLPLLAPWDLIPALPTLVHNLVTMDRVMVSYRTQYNAFILPFLLAAAAAGYARLAPDWRLRGRPVRSLALGLAFVLSLALTARTLNELALPRWWPTERQRMAYAILSQVPPAASVSTSERLVPHLAMRSKVFVLPVGLDRSDYVLLDATALPAGVRLARAPDGVALGVPGKDGTVAYRYDVVGERAGYLLLRRQAARNAERAKSG